MTISNLVFEGAGVLGIAYMGVLDYLYQNDLMKDIKRCAGTSSGAITACIASLQLPFEDIKAITESLDFKKVPSPGEFDNSTSLTEALTEEIISTIEPVLGDINCLNRLITRFGWYSSRYFYDWIRDVISSQFNDKKQPPYTFLDFKDPALHKDNRSFYDLYIVGTNLTTGTSKIFSYDTTPQMEVATAVRISMSIPLFFEAVEVKRSDITGNNLTNMFCDGGVLNNYPIKIFDDEIFNPNLFRGTNMETLGARFMTGNQSQIINNLLDYIWSLVLAFGHVQKEEHYNSPMDRIRSINIDPLDVSSIDFNISPKDNKYQILYNQGLQAAKSYFSE